jgi:hypothetical protein
MQPVLIQMMIGFGTNFDTFLFFIIILKYPFRLYLIESKFPGIIISSDFCLWQPLLHSSNYWNIYPIYGFDKVIITYVK